MVGMFDIACTGCTGKGTSMSGLKSEVADVLQIIKSSCFKKIQDLLHV